MGGGILRAAREVQLILPKNGCLQDSWQSHSPCYVEE